MCKIGDIIAVPKCVGEGRNLIGYHYFIVLSDIKGNIQGFDFDKVASVMSTFKNTEHKRKKLNLEENMGISENDGTINNKNLKDGYIKADQLHYFNKKKQHFLLLVK